MKKMSVLAALSLSAAFAPVSAAALKANEALLDLWNSVRDHFSAKLEGWGYFPHYKLAFELPLEVRRDLLLPQRDTAHAPTKRLTRVTRDRRPDIFAYLRPQNRAAFPLS